MITPMVARLVRDPFDRDGRLFELKWDGLRAIAETDGEGGVRLYSRRHNDFKKRFPPIVEAHHRARLHLSLEKDSPDPRSVQPAGEIVAIPQVGGLHHFYTRRLKPAR
jgi:ATP-dependent DNA ligase